MIRYTRSAVRNTSRTLWSVIRMPMPVVGQFADVAADVLGRLRIDRGERLVEQDQQRLAHEAAGDFQPALLAAGAAGRRCSCARGRA